MGCGGVGHPSRSPTTGGKRVTVNEECSELNAFTKAGKAVFHVEYRTDQKQYCSALTSMKFNSIKKNEDYSLYDRPYLPCK
ncbi:endo alpha-1,4 polygalactosaminidase [Nonomuraea sp. NPDC046802]|uniref:endo alpha-1,4 polygalactosaminidase n=1 Tax=Nonomuraea sp. NPDC046802 TaxID=3154919 RepID=UPI003400BAB7